MGNINYKKEYSVGGLLYSPYDKRDYKFKDLCPLGAIQIPDNYETEDAPFTYDQKESSMCASSSKEFIRFLQEREQSGLTQPFSPTFSYGDREDTDYAGEGMYLREVAKQATRGSVLYNEMPYPCTVSKSIQLVKADKTKLYEKAKPFATTSYYACSNRKEIQTAIMTTCAVQIGIPVFDCFYTPNANGQIEYNKNTAGVSDGGHSVVLYGWSTDENGKLWWKLKNSWGNSWGINGSCWLPEDYPWMDNAYVYVDENLETKFEEYQKQYCVDTVSNSESNFLKVVKSLLQNLLNFKF